MRLRASKLLLTIAGFGLLFQGGCSPEPETNYVPSSTKPQVYVSKDPEPLPVGKDPNADVVKGDDSVVPPLSVSVSLSAVPLVTDGPNSLWPRAVNLGGGTLLLIYGQDIEGFHTLKTQISRDDGLTWVEHGEVAREAVTATRELRDANLTVLPNGTILAIYRNINDGIFRIQVSASTDKGATWAARGDVDVSSGATAQNMLHPLLRVSSKGRIQAYYSKQKSRGGPLSIVMKSSSDDGKTWANELTVATRAIGNASYPAVIGLRDGSILVVFDTPRVDGDTRLVLRSTQSDNDGLTWSNTKDVYVPTNGLRSAKSPQAAIMEDGRPMIFFMSDEDTTEAECCSIKMVVANSPATFKDLSWGPQAITAVGGINNVFPSGVQTTGGDWLLFYERASNVSFNRVKIAGGL